MQTEPCEHVLQQECEPDYHCNYPSSESGESSSERGGSQCGELEIVRKKGDVPCCRQCFNDRADVAIDIALAQAKILWKHRDSRWTNKRALTEKRDGGAVSVRSVDNGGKGKGKRVLVKQKHQPTLCPSKVFCAIGNVILCYLEKFDIVQTTSHAKSLSMLQLCVKPISEVEMQPHAMHISY